MCLLAFSIMSDNNDLKQVLQLLTGLKVFTIQDIRQATNNLSSDAKIGQGKAH